MKEILPRTKLAETDGADRSNGVEHFAPSETVEIAPAPIGQYPSEEDIAIAMPRRRRWPFVMLAIVALALLAGALYLIFRPSNSVQTATVRRGTIISTVETTGKLVTERSAQLSFRTSGLVDKIYAKQGDTVKTGEVLAELDTSDLKREVQEAQTQMQIAQLNLEKVKQGPSQQDLDAAQAELNGALANLNKVKKGVSSQDIAAAEAKLNEAKANRDMVGNTAANNTEQARIAYDQAAKATQDWLDPTGQLEQARLNYETAQKNEQSQVSIADQEVREAQQALDKVKAGPSAEDLAAAQAEVDAAQAKLSKLKAGPGEADLSILQQQVNLAQLGVDGAQANLADAQIISPLNGTLLSINLDIGEMASAMQPVATVADVKSLRVEADVDEIDVGRVSAGQAVTITLDAYPGVKMPGKIETLAPGATQKQGSTVYKATVSFDPPKGVTPREGMAANVDITAQRKDNVLLLPNRAFESVDNREYVTLIESGTTRKVEVETGLSNDADTEVISGLTEGQTVTLK